MLWSLWRGVDSRVDQLVDSSVDQLSKINNNNTINTVLPAEMLQRIFRLIQNIAANVNLDLSFPLKVCFGSEDFLSRFLPPEDLKVAATVCRSISVLTIL